MNMYRIMGPAQKNRAHNPHFSDCQSPVVWPGNGGLVPPSDFAADRCVAFRACSQPRHKPAWLVIVGQQIQGHHIINRSQLSTSICHYQEVRAMINRFQ